MSYSIYNYGKYYEIRKRFHDYFFIEGRGEGEGMPFAHRIQTGNGYVSTGEATLQLGTYIAYCATEYWIFNKSGLDTQSTIGRLFHAIDALNRLDKAGSFELSGHTGLNGFLLRSDKLTPSPLAPNTGLNAYLSPGGYTVGEGTCAEVGEFASASRKPFSRDHAIRIFWGLHLAIYLLDDGLSHGSNQFTGGGTDIRTECREIYTRIAGYLMGNNWTINWLNPGDLGLNMKNDKAAIERSYDHLIQGFSSFWSPNFWGGYGPSGWMNGRIALEKQNLSGNSFAVYDRCRKLGYESYFLYYGLIIYDWGLGNWGTKGSSHTKRVTKLQQITELYLNAYPCTGNFNHDHVTDFSPLGWATADRSERGRREQFIGLGHALGNYGGLDFLMMHNLYYIYHIDDLGKFPKENGVKPCMKDCSSIDTALLIEELQLVQSQALHPGAYADDFISAYDGCFKDAIAACNSNINACKSAAVQRRNDRASSSNFFVRISAPILYTLEVIACELAGVACKIGTPFVAASCAHSKAVAKRQEVLDKTQPMFNYC